MKKPYFNFENLMTLVLFGSILINVYLSAYYVLHKDILFNTDIARDFLIMKEISEKKIVLIGPRSSAGGLFHGPLWHYLNYPAFFLGKGDPLVVGWFWISLIIGSIWINYFVAKKLFGKISALISASLFAGCIVISARGLSHPFGALFIMPLFIYSLIKYLNSQKAQFLILHFLLCGFLFQFEVSIGIPFFILSLIFSVIYIFRKKNYVHLFAILAFPLAIANFILFDIRHNFLMLRSSLNYVDTTSSKNVLNYYLVFIDRLAYFRDIFVITTFSSITKYIFLIIILLLVFITYKKVKDKNILIFLYFLFGYFFLTFLNRRVILFHQVMPLIVFTGFIIASFYKLSRFGNKYLFIALVIPLAFVVNNDLSAYNFYRQSSNSIGKVSDSWNFLNRLGKDLFNNNDQEFGYFVYSPDAFGYQSNYAVFYAASKSSKKAYPFKKLPITYLVIAPPPPDKPGMKDDWWRINQVRIFKKPTWTKFYENGYKIERYSLTAAETKIPFNPDINIGLHFR